MPASRPIVGAVVTHQRRDPLRRTSPDSGYSSRSTWHIIESMLRFRQAHSRRRRTTRAVTTTWTATACPTASATASRRDTRSERHSVTGHRLRFLRAVAVANPGTGTPGYWKNHPEAWPVDDHRRRRHLHEGPGDRLARQGRQGQDDHDVQLAGSAMLNLLIGNDGSCVASTIAAPTAGWPPTGRSGSNVAASSQAWKSASRCTG